MKKLIVVDLALLIVLSGLVVLDRAHDRRADDVRAERSEFRAIAACTEADAAAITRIIMTVPASWQVAGFEKTRKWTYVKSGDRWLLKEFDDVDGYPDEIENLTKAILGAKGTVVGDFAKDAGRYGLTPDDRMEIEWADAQGSVRARGIFGATAPGERGDECFAVSGAGGRILRIDQNPWTATAAARTARTPPFLDLGVVPRSLRRGLPERIRFAGGDAAIVREMVRREIPKSAEESAREPERGPRYEWFGLTADGEKRLSSTTSFEVAGFLMRLTSDGFGPQKKRIKDVLHTISVDWGGGQVDVFELGQAAKSGFHALYFSGTDRITWISAEKARGFTIDGARLLDLTLDQKPGTSASQPAGR